MKIIGEKTTLIPISFEHLKQLWKWIRDKEVNKFLTAIPPKTFKGEIRWFENMKKDKTEKVFAIIDNSTKKLIGSFGIHKISEKNQNCTIGIMIGDKNYWNKGYGTDTIKTMLKYCFQKLKFNKVSLYVFAENIRAQKCYEKCGFKKVGTLKENIKKDGKFVDDHIMEILAKDFI